MSEKKIVVPEGMLEAAVAAHPYCSEQLISAVIEWQRRMFLAPEPEVPEEVKDMLVEEHISRWRGEEVNEKVIEAFRRGQRSR